MEEGNKKPIHHFDGDKCWKIQEAGEYKGVGVWRRVELLDLVLAELNIAQQVRGT
jgi:hypothetical protein